MRVHEFPTDDRYCGWHSMLPTPKPARRLTGVHNADWTVLGAGFTGLAAARRIAELHPEARVVVIDAQRVGEGASGRNSGFLLDLGHYHENLGTHERLIRLGRAGISELREVVEKHQIKCDWTEQGRLHGVIRRGGVRTLERWCRRLSELEEPYTWLDANALAARTGTTYYRAAIHTPGTVLVQPAALVRGLAKGFPPSVELFEKSPVQRVRVGDGVQLECREGSVKTGRLILAANGLTRRLGFLKRRVVRIGSTGCVPAQGRSTGVMSYLSKALGGAISSCAVRRTTGGSHGTWA